MYFLTHSFIPSLEQSPIEVLYLRIQIEDAGNYKDALKYLRRLGAEAVGLTPSQRMAYSLTGDAMRV